MPDRHGTGTNGLLLAPPDAIAPSFGPDSCERHRALALAAGASCRLERPPSLLLDIDTGADLAALRERLRRRRAARRARARCSASAERARTLSSSAATERAERVADLQRARIGRPARAARGRRSRAS